MNQIDYSLVVELNRIERPSQTVVMVGQMLCEFIKFVKAPHSFEFSNDSDKTWLEILPTLKKCISQNLFDFKNKVRAAI